MRDISSPAARPPPYISGGYVALFDGTSSTAPFGPALDTLLCLIPYTLKAGLTINQLAIRVTAGAAGAAAKLALWAADAVSGRPTGLPIAGNNTGQSCATSATSPSVAVSPALFLPQARYWYGVAVTTLAPTFVGITATTQTNSSQFGRLSSNFTNASIGFTVPFPYANDIMALNLTSATFTDLVNLNGTPVMFVGTP